MGVVTFSPKPHQLHPWSIILFASELQKPIVYLPALKIYKEWKSYQLNKAIKIIQNSKHWTSLEA